MLVVSIAAPVGSTVWMLFPATTPVRFEPSVRVSTLLVNMLLFGEKPPKTVRLSVPPPKSIVPVICDPLCRVTV